MVDNFKICIITGSNLMNDHKIPFAVFDIPRFTAHFYVLMQVIEEKEQVAITGFISYEEYCNYQQTAQLKIQPDWTYTIPQSWFNSESNGLLLNLRCLSTDAIQLPAIQENSEIVNTALKQKLLTLESRIQTQNIWQLLTVQESISLLNNSELVNWVYEAVKPSPIQPLINVGNWLSNQVDEITNELGWILMPSLKLSKLRSSDNGLRSLDNFEQVRNALEQQGVNIPADAKGVYRDLEFNQNSGLTLYAIRWLLNANSDNSEWLLLIALGSQPQKNMPETLKLEVRDETELLFDQKLKDTTQGILYAQVVGNYGERFWVNITVDENTVIEIPPFGFE
ncbi:MAG: DUF1822 family protein [Cyanobacteria bacterium J06636_27]